MILIGHSGTNGSGKDTIANMLGEKHGFYVASATDMLAAELIKRGLPTERINKRTLSAEWRQQYGLGVIVDKAVEAAKAAGYDKVIVGSLRNSGEADRVHEYGGTMVWFDADPEVRYGRITANNRGRVEDQKTFEQFLAEQQAEMQHEGNDPNTLNIAAVKDLSDIMIINNDNNIDKFIALAEDKLKQFL